MGEARSCLVAADATTHCDARLGSDPLTLISCTERLSPRDLHWLRVAWDNTPGLMPPEEMFKEWVEGRIGLYRMLDGICLLQKLRSDPPELYVYAMAGKGILSNLPRIVDRMKAEARKRGCTTIGGLVHRPGLMRAYERLSARQVAVVMRMEV